MHVYLHDLNQFPLLYLDFCSLIRANDELIVCKTLKFQIRSILFSHTRLTDLVWVISIPHEKGVSSETGDKSRHRQNLQKNVVCLSISLLNRKWFFHVETQIQRGFWTSNLTLWSLLVTSIQQYKIIKDSGSSNCVQPSNFLLWSRFCRKITEISQNM